MSNLIPIVIEKTGRGERAYDIYSRLLRDRIVFLGGSIDDDAANVIIAQMLFLSNEDSKKPISFRCELFAPDRRRRKTEVVGLGQGRDVRTYRLPDGEQLIGKTLWLRAVEIGGPRILNYRFVAER